MMGSLASRLCPHELTRSHCHGASRGESLGQAVNYAWKWRWDRYIALMVAHLVSPSDGLAAAGPSLLGIPILQQEGFRGVR